MLEAALLVPPVSVADHARGNRRAPVTLVVFGDYECRYSRRAAAVVRSLESAFGASLCVVYRHAPQAPGVEHARPAALAAEAAAAQGRFWEMHDRLNAVDGPLREELLWRFARELGLDFERFDADRKSTEVHRRLYELATSAARSGVIGTPMIFLNGHRYAGAIDEASLGDAITRALEDARQGREVVASSGLGRFAQGLAIGPHHLVADLPVQDEGEDAGPSPEELLLAALASCTSLSLEALARRRNMPLERAVVRARLGTENGGPEVRRTIALTGPLTEGHVRQLAEAAEVTPVTLIVRKGARVVTRVTSGGTADTTRGAAPPAE